MHQVASFGSALTVVHGWSGEITWGDRSAVADVRPSPPSMWRQWKSATASGSVELKAVLALTKTTFLARPMAMSCR